MSGSHVVRTQVTFSFSLFSCSFGEFPLLRLCSNKHEWWIVRMVCAAKFSSAHLTLGTFWGELAFVHMINHGSFVTDRHIDTITMSNTQSYFSWYKSKFLSKKKIGEFENVIHLLKTFIGCILHEGSKCNEENEMHNYLSFDTISNSLLKVTNKNIDKNTEFNVQKCHHCSILISCTSDTILSYMIVDHFFTLTPNIWIFIHQDKTPSIYVFIDLF